MKRYILLLVTALVFAVSASADNSFRPRHRYYRHNHSLRYVRFAPRTCPECAYLARLYHVRHHHPVPPRHHAPAPPPRRHHAPAPPRHNKAKGPKHHARR